MYNLDEALADWNTAGRYGSVADRLARSRVWQPYYSHLAQRVMDERYEEDAQASRTADFMLRETILNPTDTLLDIGAGMGDYSVEFARLCASVTALDMNADCLRVLKNRAAQCALANIRCINTPWESYRENESFDVTFSAMCPAICNQEELLRLERLTRRTACLLTVTRGSYEKCRMELLRHFAVKKMGGTVTEALHYYNVLYLLGRQPNVKCWSEQLTTSASVQSLVERYAVYLRVFGIEETESVPFMRDFFGEKAVNGMVQDECKMNYALLYWNVPRE